MGERKLRVAVVGGGIGGMAAAVALIHNGVEVRVFEQAARIGEVGAGVLLAPNGRRPLEHYGLSEKLASVGATISNGSTYYRKNGEVVAPILTTDSTGWNGMWGMHRADLLGVLADSLPAGTVRTGHRVSGFEQTADSATLHFDNGVAYEADVVVAADGIHSALQHEVVPPALPVHSGSVAYRGYVPRELHPEWAENVSQLWMGDGKHFLVYPIRRGELINYVGFVPSTKEYTESWSAAGDRDQLAADFADWDPRITRLIDKVDTTFWWSLYDRAPLPKWTNGRLTLLGDAAHPMLPHLGQGANQAIEDAATLGALLAGVGVDEAPERLSLYESIRRPRTGDVQTNARANGMRYDSAAHYGDLSLRDEEISGSEPFRLWLYDHDAIHDADVALVG